MLFRIDFDPIRVIRPFVTFVIKRCRVMNSDDLNLDRRNPLTLRGQSRDNVVLSHAPQSRSQLCAQICEVPVRAHKMTRTGWVILSEWR
jgi:hypothetical protein